MEQGGEKISGCGSNGLFGEVENVFMLFLLSQNSESGQLNKGTRSLKGDTCITLDAVKKESEMFLCFSGGMARRPVR